MTATATAQRLASLEWNPTALGLFDQFAEIDERRRLRSRFYDQIYEQVTGCGEPQRKRIAQRRTEVAVVIVEAFPDELSTEELAARFGCSERTVRGDLDALKEAFPS